LASGPRDAPALTLTLTRLAQLSEKAERGASLERVVAELKGQVANQENELQAARSESTRLSHKLDGQVELLEVTKRSYDKTVKELNEVLLHKESLVNQVKASAPLRSGLTAPFGALFSRWKNGCLSRAGDWGCVCFGVGVWVLAGVGHL
jgi:uncharacterized coiled-coil protein SlyX